MILAPFCQRDAGKPQIFKRGKPSHSCRVKFSCHQSKVSGATFYRNREAGHRCPAFKFRPVRLLLVEQDGPDDRSVSW